MIITKADLFLVDKTQLLSPVHKIFFLLSLMACLLCTAKTSYGQKSEIGFGLGAFNYTGDLTRNFQAGNFGPGATIFYRRNLNEAISIRAGITGGIIRGDDTPNFDILAQQRNASYSRGIIELSPVVEYHFLNYRENINILNWTPYFFLGTGLTFFGSTDTDKDYNNLQIVLPFGVGFKYVLDRRWILGLEAGVRKTFFDYIDDVSGEDLVIKNYAYGNRHDDDWYYFLGLSLSYTFYTIPCPYHFN